MVCALEYYITRLHAGIVLWTNDSKAIYNIMSGQKEVISRVYVLTDSGKPLTFLSITLLPDINNLF
jgi:hypothetical protein